MNDWWSSLTLIQQIFYGVGIVALVVTVIQLILTLLGLGSDSLDFEFDADGGDSGHSSGLGVFSVQTISAFFMAFGWVGVVGINYGISILAAVLIAFGSGVVLMYAMYFMIKSLLRLQSRGNLKYDSVIGQTATVYVTIPGDNKDEGGQIQVTIQDRLTTANARKESPGAIKPGQKVVITAMLDQSSYLVEEI